MFSCFMAAWQSVAPVSSLICSFFLPSHMNPVSVTTKYGAYCIKCFLILSVGSGWAPPFSCPACFRIIEHQSCTPHYTLWEENRDFAAEMFCRTNIINILWCKLSFIPHVMLSSTSVSFILTCPTYFCPSVMQTKTAPVLPSNLPDWYAQI